MGKDSKHLTHLGEDELLWPDGTKVRTAGHTTLQLKYYDTTISIPAVVCHDVEGLLLSWFACEELGILKWNFHSSLPKPGTVGRQRPPRCQTVRNIEPTDVRSPGRTNENLHPRNVMFLRCKLSTLNKQR